MRMQIKPGYKPTSQARGMMAVQKPYNILLAVIIDLHMGQIAPEFLGAKWQVVLMQMFWPLDNTRKSLEILCQTPVTFCLPDISQHHCTWPSSIFVYWKQSL